MEDPVIIKIKNQFAEKGKPAKIPLMNGKKFFEARFEEDGIYVDNLGSQPFLPWKIFPEAINCLRDNGGQVKKGNAMDSRLGDFNLGLNTMEGYIASKVYGCKVGDNVFRRITPIASILAWAEICENTRGQIRLLQEKEEFQAFENEKEFTLALDIGETKESYEKAPISGTLDSRNIELRNVEKKPEKGLDRIKELENQLAQRCEATIISENRIQEKDLELRTLQDKLKTQLAEIDRYESELKENERERSSLTAELTKKLEDINTLEGRLSAKEKDLEKLEGIILIKDKDLQVLAGKYITVDGEIRKVEEKLVEKEKKINNLEVALATSDEKLKRLEKQLSDYEGKEKLTVQLREKEELIKQLKGTLASKEEEFSRLNDENRKYKRQQQFESEGLKQIEEQKASKKWWRHW